MDLVDVFTRADANASMQFLKGAKTLEAGLTLWPLSMTAAVAYFVVAAESLMDVELQRRL
jgi:hypothetical protein